MDPELPEGAGRWLKKLTERARELAVLFISPDARITWWSEGAAHIFGYTADEIVGQPCAKLFVPEDVEKGIPGQELEIALRDDAAEDDRWQLRKDGSRFWASGLLHALRGDGGKLLGFGKVLRNRTDLREQVDALRAVGADLQGEVRRKDVFLATLAHELRNPLAPLSNAVHLIRLSPAYSPDIDYPLKVIERQMVLLQRLVDDILELSRVQAGKLQLQLRPVGLGELLRHALDSCLDAAQARRQRVDLLVPEREIHFEGDPERLHQVFVNLLRNAIKYTPSGGHIWLKGTTEGEEVVARVEDDGEGIAPEMLPRIFDLFTQVESARARSEGGMGIGLALVQQIVAMHGGSVQVKSEGLGKGSEFIVRLPPRVPR